MLVLRRLAFNLLLWVAELHQIWPEHFNTIGQCEELFDQS